MMRGVTLAALASVAAIYCSTWNGISTCSSPGGATSTESRWQGMTIGQDSDGARWTTSRWRDTTITTVTPPPER